MLALFETAAIRMIWKEEVVPKVKHTNVLSKHIRSQKFHLI